MNVEHVHLVVKSSITVVSFFVTYVFYISCEASSLFSSFSFVILVAWVRVLYIYTQYIYNAGCLRGVERQTSNEAPTWFFLIYTNKHLQQSTTPQQLTFAFEVYT